MEGQNSEILIFYIITCFLLFTLITIIIAMVFFYQKKYIIYQTSLEKIKDDHEKTLLTTQLEIQESTLKSISREIHDNIGLSLTLAKLHLNSMDKIQDIDCGNFHNSAVALISEAIQNLSSLSRTLNTDFVMVNGLIKSLEKEMNYLGRLKDSRVTLEVVGNPLFLDSEKELLTFRIFQEGMNNAIKYSRATMITTTLKYDKKSLTLNITDNGKGFNYNPKLASNSGLNNIVQRTAYLNGRCSITSELNKGTSINIEIPY